MFKINRGVSLYEREKENVYQPQRVELSFGVEL